MKISVAMTTYNGEKFVEKQLQSLYDQTRQPDEVIIYDDRSTDSTVSIINNFILEKKIENWYIYINEENRGWRYNFYCAIEKCSGDIIFCSDHDDVWLDKKIELMVGVINKHPEIKCLSGGKVNIDENGDIIEKKEFSGRLLKIGNRNNFNGVTLLGCTLCVTREIADLYLKINCRDFGHDAQLCRIAALIDSAYALDSQVIWYRIHGQNSSGIKKGIPVGSSDRQRRIDSLTQNIKWFDKMLASGCFEGEVRDAAETAREFTRFRLGFLQGEKTKYLRSAIKYRKNYLNKRMIWGDFSYKHNLNVTAGKIYWFFAKLFKKKVS